MTQPYNIPDPYHPNALDLHLDEIQQEALQSLGLEQKVAQQGMEALSYHEATQVAQAMNDRSEALMSNINQQSE